MPQLVPFFKNFCFISVNRYACFHSAKPLQTKGVTPVKIYNNAGLQKSHILTENRGLAGIYRWINKLNNRTYVGSAENLSKRLAIYYRKSELLKSPRPIHKALLKYGYDNFILEILEVCPVTPSPSPGTEFKVEIIKREQYYLDLLEPEYNILKVAYSLKGYKHTKETKVILKANAEKRGVAVWVLNTETGEKFSFLTITEAGNFLGISSTSVRNAIKGGNAIKDNFIVTDDENYTVEEKSSNKGKTKVIVFNTLTNEILKFKTQSAVAKYFGLSRAAISMAIKLGNKVKDIYLLSLNENFTDDVLAKTKILQVLNTNSGESKYFANRTEIAKFLDVSTSAVTQATKGGYPIKGIYLVTNDTID